MVKNMTIIYGGSFNPPTLAHYKIAKYILDKYPNSTLYFLPTNNFYAKENLNDFQYRLEMLELVVKRLGKRAKVSDFEGRLDKYYGTYYTLSHFPNSYFVMGADNFLTIKSWINYPNLIKDFKFIIIPSEKIDLESFINNDNELKKYKENFIILDDFKEIDLSSTNFRKTKDYSLLLPEVAQYIKEKNLYKEIEDVL